MSIYVAAIGFGLVSASILAVSALGFNLTFAVSRTLNVGFIAFMLLGQFAAYEFQRATGDLWLGILLAACVSGALGFLLFEGVVRPLSKGEGEPFVLVLILLSFYTLIASVLDAVFGSGERALLVPAALQRPVHIGDMLFTVSQIIVMGCAFGLVLIIDAILRVTTAGRDIRAISDDPALARTKGVPVRTVSLAVWAISGALGGAAGAFLAVVQQSFSVTATGTYFVLITAAAFVGGAGKAYGALVGALVVGVVTQVAAIQVQSSLSPLIAFGVLVGVVLFRPGGVLGAANEGLRA